MEQSFFSRRARDMAFDRESEVGRKLVHFSTNPYFEGLQPRLQIKNPLVHGFGNTGLVAAKIAYEVCTIPGLDGSPTEARTTTLLAKKAQDIERLAKEPFFTASQMGVLNPFSEEPTWKTFVSLAPREGFLAGLPFDVPQRYVDRLSTGEVPYTWISEISPVDEFAFAKLAEGNSQAIRKLDEPKMQPGPLVEGDLQDLTDKYDPFVEYPLRYEQMIHTFVNLPGQKIVTLALLDSSERAEYLAITNNEEQEAFLQREAAEGFVDVITRVRNRQIVTAMNGLNWMVFPDYPASNGDLKQHFNRMGEGRERFPKAVKRKLLYLVNSASADLIALSQMDPEQRITTLIQSDRKTAEEMADKVAAQRKKANSLEDEIQKRAMQAWLDLNARAA